MIEASRPAPEHAVADAIAAAARQIAHTIDAKAICAFTESGSTALRVARERPEAPIIGLTTSEQTARRLAVAWGVHAVVTPDTHSMSETVGRAARLAAQEGFRVARRPYRRDRRPAVRASRLDQRAQGGGGEVSADLADPVPRHSRSVMVVATDF